jgi:hypothetical protein
MINRNLVVAVTLGILTVLIFTPNAAQGQSSSPTDDGEHSESLASVVSSENDDVITFSEYPVGMEISDQYVNQGLLFGGDTPFISVDDSNPTSPVLSGTPRFRGAIEGRFVNPLDGSTPISVKSFTLDAGYFNELASTQIEWFDFEGRKLGQRTNSRLGIETFKIEGGNIARWRISIIKTEPAGFAIDNVSFEPIQSSVLFRELFTDAVDGTWGLVDRIPGYDHTGLNIGNLVYESHPGYPAGLYSSEDGQEVVTITEKSGVQAQHTRKTFEYDRPPNANESPVSKFEEIPIDQSLAEAMRDKIETLISIGAQFQTPSFGSRDEILATLSPSSQKGGDGKYTCVGLVEWAAEQAGHNGGQGFIGDSFESFPVVSFNVDIGWPPTVDIVTKVPLLSPELLLHSMKFADSFDDLTQWVQGMFDPADFMITDPLGRKLGYTADQGEKNEIPGAFYSGDGVVEQFLIPNPVAGQYQIDLVGLGEQVYGGMSSSLHAASINKVMLVGEETSLSFRVELMPGSPGDVNFDGAINQQDQDELTGLLNTFVGTPNDPGDIDGNGVIEQTDLDLLQQLIGVPTALEEVEEPTKYGNIILLPLIVK